MTGELALTARPESRARDLLAAAAAFTAALGTFSLWSLRCARCGRPKNSWESACKPCRLRAIQERGVLDVLGYWR